MADADDIQAETWWRREIVTDELDEACDAIALGLGIARSAVGTKGNTAHDSGSHRSQEWLLNSRFCDNRSYTVQSGLTADQARHIAGIDITPGEWGTRENRRRTAEITARLIAAMKAGLLDEVHEVFGCQLDLDGVTGWNNRENRVATADSSHEEHVHLGCDRRRMRDRAFLARLVSIILGEDMFEQTDRNTLIADTWRTLGMVSMAPTIEFQIPGEKTKRVEPNRLAAAINGLSGLLAASETRDRALLAAIQALAANGGADVAPVLAAIDGVRAELGEEIGQLHAQLAAAAVREAELQTRLAAAFASAGS